MRMIRSHTLITGFGALLLAISVSLGAASALADAPPTATIDAPTVSYTSADFSGTVNPNGGPSPANWHFELSETGEPGSFFPFDGGGEISGSQAEEANPVAVESTREYLQPGHEYFVRLVASNEAGGNQVATEAKSFTTEAVALPTVSIEAPTEVSGTSAHVEGTINPGAPVGNPPAFDVNWYFECTPSCSYVSGQIAADSSQHTVSGELTALEPNTDYEVRLKASNAGGQASAGPVSMKTGQVAPAIEPLYAGSLGLHEATLAANVNPKNASTSYFFEWGTDTSYGNVAPATPQPLAASDDSLHIVTAPLTGLDEGTTYHFRVVATNNESSQTASGVDHAFTTMAPSGPPVSCPNSQFRGGVASQLPDCRAYEQVSPTHKNGADVLGYETNARAAANGNRVTFVSYGGFDGAQGLKTFEPYYATRGAQGWSTSALYPKQELSGPEFFRIYPQPLGYSEQLTSAAMELVGPPPVAGAESGTENLYTRNLDTGAFTLLTSVGAKYRAGVGISAGSSDFSHVLFETGAKLTPDAPIDNPEAQSAEPVNLYESDNGQVRLASVLPNGDPAPMGGRAGFAEVTGNGIGGGGISDFFTQNTMSIDGSRVFWTDPESLQLYARIDGTETVQVSASQRTEPEEPQPASFEGATRTGSYVFFTSGEKLTDDSTAGQGAGNPADLYRYDIATKELVDLSVSEARSAGVVGFLGATSDGSSAYFTANGAPLAAGALDESELGFQSGEEGLVNLYQWHNGEVTYVASISRNGRDANNWERYTVNSVNPKASRISADGKYLLFSSVHRLTAYDNNGQNELYRYDGMSHILTCVTCNPRRDTATAGASIGEGAPDGQASITMPPFLTNLISEDGSRVFFQTDEALLPSDGNGRSDVYEWDEGRIQLISSGQASTDSFLGDAGLNGEDVFFTTRQELVGQDTDANTDMYDARVNGGIAAQNPPPAGAPCSGDACRPVTGAAPPVAAPSSSTLSGPPNRKRHRHHGKKHRRHHQRGKHPRGRQGNGTRG
jgi:hypothetical protein